MTVASSGLGVILPDLSGMYDYVELDSQHDALDGYGQ